MIDILHNSADLRIEDFQSIDSFAEDDGVDLLSGAVSFLGVGPCLKFAITTFWFG